jgi:transposase
MAKPQQNKLARMLFVEQGKTRKEIAEQLHVREKTVGDWVRAGNWEALRTQRVTSKDSAVANLQQLISELTQQRLDMQQNDKADASEKARLTDEISKHSKTLSELREEGEVTLNARVVVMQWIFTEMEREHPKLFAQLIDFQEKLLDQAATLHA